MAAHPQAAVGASFAPDVPKGIAEFLQQPSSTEWASALANDLPTLLSDHASCELKAASTAISLMHRYAQFDAVVHRMSRLAREELRHFEQVKKWQRHYDIDQQTVSAAGYAGGLRAAARSSEPHRLVDTLIIGALIEARSCERFALIAPLLDAPLAAFYRGLLASEARHFELYLELATGVADASIDTRIDDIRAVEQDLIMRRTDQVRFHSGPPTVIAH